MARQELLERRARNAKHFENDDGTFTAEIGGALHFFDEDLQEWRDEDQTLVPDGGGAGGHMAPDSEVPARLIQRGNNWFLSTTLRSNGKGIEYQLPGTPTVGNPGNAVRFTWGTPGIQFAYYNTAAGLKLEATFSENRGPQSYSFVANILGGARALEVNAETGALESDEFTLRPPYAMDANRTRREASAWRIQGNIVSFDFDDTGLALPYTLDPTTNFDVAGSADEGQTYRPGATYPPTGTTEVYLTQPGLGLARSKFTNFEIRNTVLRFDTSSLDDAATVTGASLRMRVGYRGAVDSRNVALEWYSWTPPATTAVYAEASSSTAGSVPYASVPAVGNDVTFTLSNVAANVNKTGYTGLRLHTDGGAPTGDNDLNFNAFAAGANIPRLTVDYIVSLITQDRYRFRNDDGSESSATWLAALNTGASIEEGAAFRVRIGVNTSAAIAADQILQLQYNLNSAGWNNVTSSSSVVRSEASANVADAAATSEQLGGSGTFRAGEFDEVDGQARAFFGVAGGAGEDSEVEFSCRLIRADVAGGDTVELRLIDQATAGVLAGYTQTPTINVTAMPTERLWPSAEVSKTGYTSGAFGDADEDPTGTLDGTKYTAADPSELTGLTNGPEYPNARAQATGQTAFGWNTPANVTDTSDTTLASIVSAATAHGDYFTIPAAAFSDLPATAVITGATYHVKHRAGSTNRCNVFAQMGTANGTLIGTEVTIASNLGTTAGGITHNIAAAGTMPTRAQLINGTFGIRLRLTRSNTSTYELYSVKMTVTYSIPGVQVATAVRFAMTDLTSPRILREG